MRKRFKSQFGLRQRESRKLLYQSQEPRVLSGPFKGMYYLDEIVWGPIEPKWLGTYECELKDVVLRLFDQAYSKIIDIGSAEGYYAVGLAGRFPQSMVVAFDVDPQARKQVRRLAQLNKRANIKVRSLCTVKELDRLTKGGRPLVVIDAEGAEYDLLRPDQCPGLNNCDILAELHSFGDTSIENGISRIFHHFETTHDIIIICVQKREAALIADALGIETSDPALFSEIIDEHRDPKQVWLWMTKRHS